MTAQTITDDVKRRTTWSIFMGILTAALGVFLILYPLATATVTTVLLGWALIFVGIAHFIFALHSQTIGTFFLRVLGAALYAICGIVLALFPLQGVAALTMLLGALVLAQGALLTVTAFQVKPRDGWGWFLVDGVASLLLGLLIVARWPSSSICAIGTLVGVAVLMSGISRIMIATKIRRGTEEVTRFARAA